MRRGLVIFAVFTALAVAFAPQVWLDFAYAGSPVSWPNAIGRSALDWYLWAAVTPLVFALERRLPFSRGQWLRAAAIHAAVGLATTLAILVLQLRLSTWLFGIRHAPTSLLKVYLAAFTYAAIVAAAAGLRSWRAQRDRELQTTQLERALAVAQLDAVKSRLDPHFLFNTLNGIATLIHEEPDRADQMLTRLSTLLRHVLEYGGADLTGLDAELRLLEQYLDIERMRFGDRLTIHLHIDPAASAFLVPSFVLQPLVENALRHGVSKIPGPATITVDARVERGQLVIAIDDDGPGPAEAAASRHGLGTTARRLHHLYGDAASITLSRRPTGGARARLVLPAQRTRPS